MKVFLIAMVMAVILHPTLGLAQNALKPLQAELIRSTTGRGIDGSGLANNPVPLPKGAIYDVVRQDNGSVVLIVNGQNVVVQKAAVRVTDKPQVATVSSDGFVPGKIVLLSAKYSLDGNQPRNVKNNLQKLIPQSIITAPIEIIVTDALSSAAQDQGASQATVVITSDGTVGISMRKASKNVLTVQYLYNGQRFTKQVPEGKTLILP